MSRRGRAQEDSPRLTFEWVVPESTIWRLLFYAGITVVTLAGFFFVFRVVYPESDRPPLVSRRVLVLSENDPDARPLIQRAVDQSFALLPTPAEDPAKEAALPEFRPSFEGYRMRLKGLPVTKVNEPAKRMFSPGRVVLPPAERQDIERSPRTRSGFESALTVQVSGEASDRFEGRAPIRGLALVEPIRLRFRVAVNERGLVVFALPLESIEDADVQTQLLGAVERLRFKPVSENGVMWADAAFEWTEVEES